MTARVALLTTNLARGGAETQVALLARGLRARGWSVSVISLLPPTAFEPELTSAGVPVFSLDMEPGRPDPLGCWCLLRILRDLRPHILHSHMFHANLMARLVRLLAPVPVLISTVHSVAESGRGSDSMFWRDWLYRITGPLATQTVAVTKAVPGKNLRVIPNGVDTTRFRPNPAVRLKMREQLGLGQEFVWLAAGRLMWKKGYETMLRAWARLDGGVLLIAGAGPQESELRGLGSGARFLGKREDVADLMAAADGFVQSSVVEGLPVALLEAASSGLPCVAADTGGVSEIVLNERTGYLVPAADVASLAAAMSRMMSLASEQRRQMGVAAREHVCGQFDQNVVLSRWEELYRELLEPWT
jgi:glycosyltransferase involved in cell wall biosynthesis